MEGHNESENLPASTDRREIGFVLEENDEPINRKTNNKLKKIAPQILAVTASSFFFCLTQPVVTLFSGEESRNWPFLNINNLGSAILVLCGAFGCVLSGVITKHYGYKRTMMSANIVLMLSFIIFYYDPTEIVFIQVKLMYIGSGMGLASMYSYIAGVTQPHVRGVLSATSLLAYSIGNPLLIELVRHITLEGISPILAALSIVSLLSLFFIPENPYWLAGEEKFSEAQKSLEWLRRWSTPLQVDEEMKMIREMMDYPEGANKKKSYICTKRFRSSFKLIFISFFIVALEKILMSYLDFLFGPKNLGEIYFYLLIVSVVVFLCALVWIILFYYLGRRLLNLISIIGFIIVYSNLMIVLIHDHFVQWTGILLGILFSAKTTIQVLAMTFLGEVFSTPVQTVPAGITVAFFYICPLLATGVLKFLDSIGLSPFSEQLIFFMIMIFGTFKLHFEQPETAGATLKEIDEHYAGIRELKLRKVKTQILE